jgi:two-component system, chemotaxis family, chemotaxis protein CheY
MACVMIVDDSLLMRRQIVALFESYTSCKVVAEAMNGVDAVLKFREFKPDLVTMDITMPVQGGLDSAKQIKSEFPAAKIIMVSSSAEKEIVLEALKYGAVGYLVKPISTQKFLNVIGKAIPNETITPPAGAVKSEEPTTPQSGG